MGNSKSKFKAKTKPIKHAMVDKDLNIKGLAEQVKMAPNYVSEIINNKKDTTYGTAFIFGMVLDKEIDDIFEVKN